MRHVCANKHVFVTAKTKLMKRLGKKQGISDKLRQYLHNQKDLKIRSTKTWRKPEKSAVLFFSSNLLY